MGNGFFFFFLIQYFYFEIPVCGVNFSTFFLFIFCLMFCLLEQLFKKKKSDICAFPFNVILLFVFSCRVLRKTGPEAQSVRRKQPVWTRLCLDLR